VDWGGQNGMAADQNEGEMIYSDHRKLLLAGDAY
jgi:hypothetical protein